MFKEKFSIEELERARQNGYILTGKTGAGKSTLLNAIYGEIVAKAEASAISVTTESEVYYYKLSNGNCISIIDTPGLFDARKYKNKNKEDIDILHLKGIEQKITEEKVHIKGILFLVNFQEERFDSSEQEALLSYNALFPLKSFWDHLIVIFTHHFCDPDGDDIEQMKKNRDKSNGQIFSTLMEKVKDVSNVIDYQKLKVKYYNSYSPTRTQKQIEKNRKNKEDLEILINDLNKGQPLFCQIEIIHIKNEIYKENGEEYLAEYERVDYYDLNHNPIKVQLNFIKKELIKKEEKQYIPPPSAEVKVINAKKNNNGSLKHSMEDGNEKNSNFIKNNKVGTILGGLGGGIAGGLGGLAVAGLNAGATGTLITLITEGAFAGACAFGFPVVIGAAGVGLIGSGLGFCVSKLFN